MTIQEQKEHREWFIKMNAVAMVEALEAKVLRQQGRLEYLEESRREIRKGRNAAVAAEREANCSSPLLRALAANCT